MNMAATSSAFFRVVESGDGLVCPNLYCIHVKILILSKLDSGLRLGMISIK